VCGKNIQTIEASTSATLSVKWLLEVAVVLYRHAKRMFFLVLYGDLETFSTGRRKRDMLCKQ